MPSGFKIRGIAPYELRTYPDPVRLLYWGWVLELGLKAKDRDLSRGLDAFGEPLRAIGLATRKHRKSAMTPDGRGDPSAPPLMPGRKLSRTRSLLAGRAFTTHAEFYWRFDPWTHDTWAKILTYQKQRGRDVFGLSEESTDLVRRQALARWTQWKRTGMAPLELEGKRVLGLGTPQAPATIPMTGRQIGPTSIFGIGKESAFGLVPGKWSGGFTEAELKQVMRAPAKVSIPGRPEGTYNRLLGHIWSGPEPGASAVVPLLPTPKPPMAPPKPEPPATFKGRLDAWKEGDATVKAIQDLAEKADPEHRAKRSYDASDELDAYVASLKPGDRRKKAVREKLKELTEKKTDAYRWAFRTAEKTREEIAKILKADKPVKYVFDDTLPVDAVKLRAEAKAGADWLFPLINDPKQLNQVPAMLVIADSPAGLTRANAGGTGIHLTLLTEAKTVVHEIGHCLEDQLKGVVQLERQFLEHRRKGQPDRHFKDLFPDHGYKDDEKGFDDEFGKYFSPEGSGGLENKSSSWYVGKYSVNRSEVLTMGLQALYDDGVTFAHKDPEFFKLIVGILSGALR